MVKERLWGRRVDGCEEGRSWNWGMVKGNEGGGQNYMETLLYFR